MVMWKQKCKVILSCKVLTVLQGQQTSTFSAPVKGCLGQAELRGGAFPVKVSEAGLRMVGFMGPRWKHAASQAGAPQRKAGEKETFQEDASNLQKKPRSSVRAAGGSACSESMGLECRPEARLSCGLETPSLHSPLVL